MIEKIPEKLIGFYPPDYELDGSEVLEMIKDMPEKINLPISIKPNSMKEMNVEKCSKRHPERVVPPLDNKAIKVLYCAVQEMLKIFEILKKPSKKRPAKKSLQKKSKEVDYSISEYVVSLSLHIDYDIADVAFCPKVENWLDAPGDGPSEDFYFKLSSQELLKRYGMR